MVHVHIFICHKEHRAPLAGQFEQVLKPSFALRGLIDKFVASDCDLGAVQFCCWFLSNHRPASSSQLDWQFSVGETDLPQHSNGPGLWNRTRMSCVSFVFLQPLTKHLQASSTSSPALGTMSSDCSAPPAFSVVGTLTKNDRHRRQPHFLYFHFPSVRSSRLTIASGELQMGEVD